MRSIGPLTAEVLFGIVFIFTSCLAGAAGKGPTVPSAPPVGTQPERIYHSLIPLGSEILSYSTRKEHQIFYVMASAQNRQFEGDQVWFDGVRHVLKGPNGNLVQAYPQEVRFRVSVSEHSGYPLLMDSPLPIESHASTFNQLITSLKFEMRVYHALKARIIHPTKVTHIGVPPDVPASERVYEVTFDVGDVPITDRIVMHVLTGEGDRMAKFNLDLY